MGRLNAYIYVAEQLDARLAAKIAEVERADPDRAKALSQDVLFYVRQKHQDLLTQLAVSIQSYLAIDVIIRGNLELFKGVDRASTTTVSALRTGGGGGAAGGAHNHGGGRQLRLDPAAGGLGHGRVAAAAGRLPKHLRDHGRDRHLQAAGPGLDGGDHRLARGRGGQVAGC